MEKLFAIFIPLVIVTIISTFIYRRIYGSDSKKYKYMTKKIRATIIKSKIPNYVYYDRKFTYSKLGCPLYVDYEFVVNSQTYRGFGVKLNYSTKRVNVYYNPTNPNENITVYEKYRATGTIVIMGMIVAVFCIFILPLLFMKVFL